MYLLQNYDIDTSLSMKYFFHQSEFSLRKDVTERRQGEKYRQLFREFFSDPLISVCFHLVH